MRAEAVKLEACEQSLAALSIEAGDLRGRLAQLQHEATRLSQLLAEREVLVLELQHDYAEVNDRAITASASLAEAEAQLRRGVEQVADLEQQRDALWCRCESSEQGLGDLTAALLAQHSTVEAQVKEVDVLGAARAQEAQDAIEQLRRWLDEHFRLEAEEAAAKRAAQAEAVQEIGAKTAEAERVLHSKLDELSSEVVELRQSLETHAVIQEGKPPSSGRKGKGQKSSKKKHRGGSAEQRRSCHR